MPADLMPPLLVLTAVVFESSRRRMDAALGECHVVVVRPGATGCDAMRPGATDLRRVQNEPICHSAGFAASAASSLALGERFKNPLGRDAQVHARQVTPVDVGRP